MATPWSSAYHAPVLAEEVLRLLGQASTVVDGTLGGGGHALALFESEGVESVIGIDRDPGAIETARQRLSEFEKSGRFRAIAGNYADPAVIAELPARVDAVLLDLGVSSRQLDAEDRGFTFREGARLDMRMDPDAPVDAAGWLATADEKTIADVLHGYADERKAYRMAREIVRRRETRPFATSDDLVGAIRAVLGPRSGPPDFARIFQAIRIAVNDELTGLAAALPALRDRLVPGGRFLVITYHSGEDRLVKNAFREWSADCVCPPRQPVCTCRGKALGETLTRKAIVAGEAEIAANPRARSAHLRAWQSAR